MTFKSAWEKTNSHISVPDSVIGDILSRIFNLEKVIQVQPASHGCANLNYKITTDDSRRFILRIYIRDSSAAYREQKIGHLLHNTVPVPHMLFLEEQAPFTFALFDFIEGITMSKLLLSTKDENIITPLMRQAANYLASIHQHEFDSAGFFDENFHISTTLKQGDYLLYAQKCLSHETAVKIIAKPLIQDIHNLLQTHSHLYPGPESHTLTHGDFDPANILVHNTNQKWEISGILDWEFAFSGSILCDIANMTRYAFEMPATFEDSFINELKTKGVDLPDDWQPRCHMINMVSLLDCLTRADALNRPNQCSDIIRLLNHIVLQLKDRA